MINLKNLVLTLLIVPQFFLVVEACSVNTLRSSSFCSSALTANRSDILKGDDSAPINCLSLEQYCQTIERAKSPFSHRSFERAIALYNAQRTLKDLSQFLDNRDVKRLQNELTRAFTENIRSLGEFSQFSVLNDSGFPLSQNEEVFFFGVQKKSANQLYVLEGRRKTDGTVRLVETKLHPKNLSVPAAPADIALLVNNIQTQRMRYVLLNQINSNAFQSSDRVRGFYLKDMRIIVPVVSGMWIEEFNTLSNELKSWLKLSGENSQGGYSSYGEGVAPPASFYGSNYSNSSTNSDSSTSKSCEQANTIGNRCRVTTDSGLTLRKTPNGIKIIVLDNGTIVNTLNDINMAVNNSVNWVCIDAGASGKGWVARKYLTCF